MAGQGGIDQIPAGGSALTFDEMGRPFIIMKARSISISIPQLSSKLITMHLTNVALFRL
jgi:hypothetical protein